MVDVANQPSDKVRLYAYLSAVVETGFTNPLDEAIRRIPGMDTSGYVKADEVPYDFLRKRLSLVVENAAKQHLMLTKIGLIRRFMIVFGVQSSLFDYVTFGALLFIFHAGEAVFQTGWFVESVLTEVLVLLIIRTTGPALKSRPSTWLLWTSIGTVIIAIVLPSLPLGQWIGLVPLPLTVLGFMIAIAALYGILVEATKRRFFRKAQL